MLASSFLLGLCGLTTLVAATPTDPPVDAPEPKADPVSCPFNGTVGPMLMLANVT